MKFNNHQASTYMMVNVSQVTNFQGLIFDPSEETFDIIFCNFQAILRDYAGFRVRARH